MTTVIDEVGWHCRGARARGAESRTPERNDRSRRNWTCGQGNKSANQPFRSGHSRPRSIFRILSRVCALVLIVVTTASVAVAEGAGLNVYAVIVGSVKFEDPEIPPLKLSARDATDFYQFLKERQSMFSGMHLTLLVNERATRANITEAIRNKLRAAGRDDVVIIYLSGHGAVDDRVSNEFYFVTYDARRNNLFGTALLMNDKNLFKGIVSERCLLLADACHSGGFSSGLAKGAKSAFRLSLFEGVRGRIGIASSRPQERSYERPVFGNSVFTHFLLKGLRGEAATGNRKDTVSVRSLFDYVARETNQATAGDQNPQLYNAEMADLDAPVFQVPAYSSPLQLKVQFQYEDQAGRIEPLTSGSVLRSGQRLGVAFTPESDSFVYILWKDSAGGMGVLFPNPELTAGTGRVRGGQTYWLPSQDGERWYVLDENPGDETLYLAASRQENPKLEQLCSALRSTGDSPPGKGLVAAKELEREINLMGFADFTSTRKKSTAGTARTRTDLFSAMDTRIKVSGADSIYVVTFKHVPR